MIVMIILVAFLLLVGTLIHPKNSVIIGLTFGTLISTIYIYMMANRVKKLEHVPLERMVAFMKMGSSMRLTLIIVSLYFVFRSSNINLYGAGIGVIIGPIMLSIIGFIDAFIWTRKGE